MIYFQIEKFFILYNMRKIYKQRSMDIQKIPNTFSFVFGKSLICRLDQPMDCFIYFFSDIGPVHGIEVDAIHAL